MAPKQGKAIPLVAWMVLVVGVLVAAAVVLLR
jgi:hypothetical protein